MKEKVRVKGKVRTKGERDPRADALIVVGPTTHQIAQQGKGEKEVKQVNSRINKTHGDNKISKTHGDNRVNKEHITPCPNQ